MRTKASFKGHSIHQMLIPFPIAFLYGSAVSDTIGLITGKEDFLTTGAYLIIAGIIMGLIAAFPGLIDYIFSVPPESSGKKRATQHMLVNVSTILIFFIAFLLRDGIPGSPAGIPIILEYLGAGMLTMGGWLGGTLVNRNFIGPDHRYANKGKWNEESFSSDEKIIKIAGNDELLVDQMKLIKVKGNRIVLARTEEGYALFEDKCSHRGSSLADGVLICSTVQCLWHGSQFNVFTGELKAGPAEKPIKVYPVDVRNDGCYLDTSKIS